MFSIGQVAQKTGIKIPTIRYYESEKLVEAVGRTRGNQRRYAATDLNRLVFIKHARDLGLALGDIRELLALSTDPDQPCDRANQLAAAHLQNVQARISKLQALEKELNRIAHSCTGHTVGECQVIEALSNHALCKHEH